MITQNLVIYPVLNPVRTCGKYSDYNTTQECFNTLDKKVLVWFQEHKDNFVDVTTLKMMFSKGITHGEKQKGLNCNHGIFLSLTLKRLMSMNTLI